MRDVWGMSEYRRPHVNGACVFFTVALAQRGAWLLVDEVARLRAAVRVTMAERPFGIAAFVVLPDHLHAVWQMPEGDADFATRWGAIKARFSMGLPEGRVRASHIARREKAIWQRRYWEHHIRDEADYQAHVRYCWGNPVKHGFVERAVDWPYSSIHRDIRLGRVEAEWSGVVMEGEFGEM
jgi:putative transposase